MLATKAGRPPPQAELGERRVAEQVEHALVARLVFGVPPKVPVEVCHPGLMVPLEKQERRLAHAGGGGPRADQTREDVEDGEGVVEALRPDLLVLQAPGGRTGAFKTSGRLVQEVEEHGAKTRHGHLDAFVPDDSVVRLEPVGRDLDGDEMGLVIGEFNAEPLVLLTSNKLSAVLVAREEVGTERTRRTASKSFSSAAIADVRSCGDETVRLRLCRRGVRQLAWRSRSFERGNS